jgi:hypothetical protein
MAAVALVARHTMTTAVATVGVCPISLMIPLYGNGLECAPSARQDGAFRSLQDEVPGGPEGNPDTPSVITKVIGSIYRFSNDTSCAA